MRVVAIVPCRAGSKGIPSKNRMEFHGMPLFMWSVGAALEDERIRTVCVTTDDEEIIGWCKWASIRDKRIACVVRPSDMATDESPTETGLFHACDEIGVMKHELVVLLQPTSPVRHMGLLSRCIEGSDQTGSSFSYSSPGHISWVKTGRHAVPLYDPRHRPRRQDLGGHPQVIFEDGNVYCSMYDQMCITGTRFGERPLAVESDFIHGVQIDTLKDAQIIKHLCADEAVKSWMEKVQLLLPK